MNGSTVRAGRQLGVWLVTVLCASCAADAPSSGSGQVSGVPARARRAVLLAPAGTVTVKRADGDAWIPAVERMELFENDKVRTARGAAAQLRFETGSSLTLSEDALVGVAEPRPRPGDEVSDVTVLKGRIDAELPHPDRQSITVTTPSATVRAGREIVFQ
jgi:hypothetical protein